MSQPQGFGRIAEREQGLKRRLSSGQMSMIAIGGAIGTGLFLGSKFAIGFAGPSVLISYAIGGLITLLLMGCLAEMTVAHSTSGSFGAYAEHYIGPLAGFLVRYAYWSCVVLAVGTEVTAVAEYMKFWFPSVPGWQWVCVFSAALIFINAMSVKAFGTVEYWFSTIKVSAIVAFIVLGAYVVWGSPEHGVAQYTAHGGFFPNGVWGMWVAVVISIFSYLSVEMIAVAAGEAEDPERAVKQAFRATIVRLVVFYLLTLALILAIVPWDQAGKGGSPFVKVMQAVDIPYAAGVINFIVLVAALSAMNSQLYITTRMMFSLSRAGHAPAALPAYARRHAAERAAAVDQRHRHRHGAERAVSGDLVHADDGHLHVRRAVHLDDDLRHALFLPPSLGARGRGAAVVPHAGLSGADAAGGAGHAGDPAHHLLHVGVQDDAGVRRALPVGAVGAVLPAVQEAWRAGGVAGGAGASMRPAPAWRKAASMARARAGKERDAYTAWTWGDTPRAEVTV